MDNYQRSNNRDLIAEETDLKRRLELLAYNNGGDFFGVADLEPAREFIVAQGGNALGRFPCAVSIGMRLSDAIVDQHSPEERREYSLYWHHVYQVVTPALDLIAQKTQRQLQHRGFTAFPIPASLYNSETLKCVFPHKLAAHLAGLGWIGKSCLLINPSFGARVRLVTVLTDAPLSPETPLDEQCGKCQACVVACPVQAFNGIEFQSTDPVEVRFNTRACAEYRRTHPCGLCVAKCPVGRHT
ncbi:4Fe-4S dicluster domain-containing protein [Chloroflexota bacterium]